MALDIEVPVAMKPPLYRPPLNRSVSQYSNGSLNRSEVQDSQLLLHRSASVDSPGVFNRPASPDTQGSFNRSASLDSNTSSNEADLYSTTDGFSSGTSIRPPPLPPLNFIHSGSSPVAWSHKYCKGTVGVCVPKEAVETWDKLFSEGINADVNICTEDGGITAAHSFMLAASSPVFKSLLQQQQPGKHHRRTIHILGVPYDAGRVFTRFLYSSQYKKEEMQKYVLHLLVLSHVYSIPLLKRICTEEFEHGFLTTDNVIDVLQLARLCDVPRLNLMCLRLVVNSFKTVVKSEGWRVMRESNQALEEELVGHVIEADARRQEKLRKSEEDKVYKQLHDAMEALIHICRDGCRTIGPYDKSWDGQKPASCNFSACKGLESLVRHFAGCRTKVSGGCVHCKRMWQLLELHSRMCGDPEACKVPLCKHFKDRIGQQTKKEEGRWNLLVSKVMAAKGASTGFSLAAVSATLEQET